MNDQLARAHRMMAGFYCVLLIIFFAYIALTQTASAMSSIIFVSVLFGVLAFFHFVASKGVESSKRWARVISVVLGAFLLIGFPIGTAIGGYLLYLALGAWETFDASTPARAA